MAKRIKLKNLLKENFSGAMLGGVVSRSPWQNDISLSRIVKEKFGDTTEAEDIDIKSFVKEVSNYNSLSKDLFGASNLKELAEKLSYMAKTAKAHTLKETDDWFDKVTVNRNMKELTNLSNKFKKIASEAHTLQERMGAMYEDMGNILGRYYDINEVEEGQKSSYRSGDELEGDEVEEVEGDKAEYQKFFMAALKKFGVKEPDQLPDEKKAEFYNYVDANWKGDNESD